MSSYQLFNNQRAKNTFGSLNEPVNSSDYIKNKKSKIIYNRKIDKRYNNNGYNNFKSQSSYEDYNLFNRGFRINRSELNGLIPFSKADLQINLITKLDLECVPTLSSSIIYTKTINSSVPPTSPTGTLPLIGYFNNISNYPFWYLYNTDPDGLLFGYNNCTIKNYLKYMVINNPKKVYDTYTDVALLNENC